MGKLRKNEIKFDYFTDGYVRVRHGQSVPQSIARFMSLPLMKSGYSPVKKNKNGILYRNTEYSKDSIELIKSNSFYYYPEFLEKAAPAFSSFASQPSGAMQNQNPILGQTKSGKSVAMHGHPSVKAYDSSDHKDAANIHYQAAQSTTHNSTKMHHLKQAKRHMNLASSSSSMSSGGVSKPQSEIKYVNIPGKGRGVPK